jgi:hypothetical protein
MARQGVQTIYNPSTWEAKQEDHEFEASLGYIDPVSKTNEQKRNTILQRHHNYVATS